MRLLKTMCGHIKMKDKKLLNAKAILKVKPTDNGKTYAAKVNFSLNPENFLMVGFRTNLINNYIDQ